MLTSIDLFAGCGGLSEGLSSAGFSLVFANEVEGNFAASLKANHQESEVLVDDIRNVIPKSIRKGLMFQKGELDLLAGGPPCQGFSINAPHRGPHDTRNTLFYSFLRFAEEFLPKFVLLENVPGIISYEQGKTVRQIAKLLEKIGYECAIKLLYSPNYGIPQIRWRAIIIGTRLRIKSSELFPTPTHITYGKSNFVSKLSGVELKDSREQIENNATQKAINVRDAIGDLPEVENGGGQPVMEYTLRPFTRYQSVCRRESKHVLNHQCSKLGKSNLQRLAYIPPGGSWRDVPRELLPAGMRKARKSDHTKRYGRLRYDDFASTILTKCDPHWGAFIHPEQDRVLTVREAARLQSFSDKTTIIGSVTQQYQQVGNAVPPLLAKQIGGKIISKMNARDNS